MSQGQRLSSGVGPRNQVCWLTPVLVPYTPRGLVAADPNRPALCAWQAGGPGSGQTKVLENGLSMGVRWRWPAAMALGKT